MARVCERCGKGTTTGNTITRRGLAKKKGGVGRKVTGITRRSFKPNLQTLRVEEPDGRIHRVRLCMRCLKKGGLKKPRPRQIPETPSE
ncbi:MAG: 50S ribosomal protein L28 [Planctomycetes bacterium]|nr:50S ribosomal protein L28 [Planctomycetota bacterium]